MIINRESVEKTIKVNLKNNVENLYGLDDEVTEGFDFTQMNFHCCGISNFTDYRTSKWWKTQTDKDGNKFKGGLGLG